MPSFETLSDIFTHLSVLYKNISLYFKRRYQQYIIINMWQSERTYRSFFDIIKPKLNTSKWLLSIWMFSEWLEQLNGQDSAIAQRSQRLTAFGRWQDLYDRNDQMDTRLKSLFQEQKAQQQEASITAWITQKSAYFVKQIIIEMWLS